MAMVALIWRGVDGCDGVDGDMRIVSTRWGGDGVDGVGVDSVLMYDAFIMPDRGPALYFIMLM
jgi:hypothetical protein